MDLECVGLSSELADTWYALDFMMETLLGLIQRGDLIQFRNWSLSKSIQNPNGWGLAGDWGGRARSSEDDACSNLRYFHENLRT